jgi:hypothetical protein
MIKDDVNRLTNETMDLDNPIWGEEARYLMVAYQRLVEDIALMKQVKI